MSLRTAYSRYVEKYGSTNGGYAQNMERSGVLMGRIKNHLTFLVIFQLFVLLLAVGVYPQHDAELMGW